MGCGVILYSIKWGLNGAVTNDIENLVGHVARKCGSTETTFGVVPTPTTRRLVLSPCLRPRVGPTGDRNWH